MEALEGTVLHDRTGDRLGTVAGVYVDEVTGRPKFASVTSGLLGRRHTVIPLAGLEGDRAAVLREQVEHAPEVADDGHLSRDEEQALLRHYGLDTVTLYGEQVHVATEVRPREVVRLRKRTVTEMVTKVVPVTREVVELERIPVDQLSDVERAELVAGGGELLSGEDVVISKDTVPVERARLVTDVVDGEETVESPVDREEAVLDEGPASEAYAEEVPVDHTDPEEPATEAIPVLEQPGRRV